MSDLASNMKKALATTFSFYLKAHNFHWNVEGSNFAQYHDFFSDIYTDAFGAVDTIAEHIRTLKEYAPGSYTRFAELSLIKDETNIPGAMSMINKLLEDNQKVIDILTEACKSADDAGKIGISNFLQDRIDIHEKHGWMLRSFTKG